MNTLGSIVNEKYTRIESETEILYTKKNYSVKYINGNLLIPVGGFQSEEPEVDLSGLRPQEITDLLNLKFQESRRVCFICGNKGYLGICCRLYPTDISDEERELQSQEAKKMNEREKEKTSEEEVSSFHQPIERFYNPYPIVSPLTESVKEAKKDQHFRLSIELVPCYICVHCRRVGESGTRRETTGSHPCFKGIPCQILSSGERNLKNKYVQRNYQIAKFKDKDGTSYPITDRFCIIKNAGSAAVLEGCLLEQLELMYNPALIRTAKNTVDIDKKSEHISVLVRNVIPALLRAAAKVMVKSGSSGGSSIEFKEMQDFEPTYEYSIVIIRNFLHLITKYPKIQEYLIRSVYLWVSNPFSKDSKKIFQNWMDVVWIAALCKVPFSHIRHPITLYLFHILTHNYNPTDGKMENMDKKTYLRRVFNEGRSRNASRELLYAVAFSGMIYSKLTELNYQGLSDLMDRHSCYLPEECLLTVWREMKEVNNIESLEPMVQKESGLIETTISYAKKLVKLETSEDSAYNPGLFKHLGLGDRSSDIPATIEHIYKFLNYCRTYGTLMKDVELPENIVEIISNMKCEVNNIFNVSSVERARILNEEENKRIEKLREIHSQPLPVDKEKGAPRLTDLVCAYRGCGKKFRSITEFKTHLEEAWKMDRDYKEFSMVERHRMACNTPSKFDIPFNIAFGADVYHPLSSCWDYKPLESPLTEEKVISENITECPAEHCGKTFSTPEELIYHFISLGIEPFWKPGMAVENEIEEEKSDQEIVGSIWDNPGICIICLEESCSHVNLDCGHVNMCKTCYDIWIRRSKTCPSCRAEINRIIPIVELDRNRINEMANIKIFVM